MVATFMIQGLKHDFRAANEMRLKKASSEDCLHNNNHDNNNMNIYLKGP